jgi:hypothetical protein
MPLIVEIASTAAVVPACIALTRWVMSSVALAVSWASSLTRWFQRPYYATAADRPESVAPQRF